MQLLSPESDYGELMIAEVLIVEDASTDLQLLTQILAQAGYSVRVAQSGFTALQSIQMRRPDLILLDISLPDIDGYRVCIQLKGEPEYQQIPIIFLSGMVQAADKVRAFACGGSDYITKPYQGKELLARVQFHLQHQQSQQKLQNQNQQLRQQEERWQLLIQGTGDGICDLDLRSNEIYLSGQYWAMLGYPPREQVISLGEWEQLVHPEDQAQLQQQVQAYLNQQRPDYTVEFRLRCHNGEYKWILARGKATWDDQGRPLRMVGVHQDISDRKRAEAIIQANLLQEKAIARITNCIHCSLDPNQIFATTMVTLRELLECDRILIYRLKPDWQGQVIAEATTNHPDSLLESSDRMAILQEIVEAVLTRSPPAADENFNVPVHTVSDIAQIELGKSYGQFLEQLQVKAYAVVPIYGRKGLWGMLAAYQNQAGREWSSNDKAILAETALQIGLALEQADLMAQLQQKTAELEQAKTAAEAANDAKSTFLANMSHELRTPLNAILGYAQVIARDPDLSRLHREQIQVILNSGEHLLLLINSVLDFAKIEAGRMEICPQSFVLQDLAQHLQEMFAPQAAAKGIQLRLELMSPVPDRVIADLGKLRQVLINLIGNGIKFTHQGQVALRIWVRQEDQAAPPNPAELNFAVTDTGVGIPVEEQASIFKAFEQSSLTQGLNSGTGLGLAISQRLIAMLGGQLQLHSQPGEGSTFEFAIPLQEDALASDVTQKMTRVVGLLTPHPQYRVLVVDDAYINRRIIMRLLQSTRFQVWEAEDGQAAIRAWQTLQPDLILMDMRMPKLDGYGVARHIRQQEQAAEPPRPSTKIIAVTAAALDNEQQDAIAAGCDTVLTKPIQVDSFFTQIGELLDIPCRHEITPANLG